MNDSQQWICPHCGTEQIGPSVTCWLCHKLLDWKSPSMPTPIQMAPHKPERLSFSLATMFLLISLASVCLGLLVTVPGLGIFACIILVPVFFRTMRVVRHRESKGQTVGSAEKVSLFLGSFVVSSVLVIVVCVAAFCSFCGVCMTMFSLGGDPEILPITLGCCAIGVGAIFVAARLIKWNNQRYRRDMGGE